MTATSLVIILIMMAVIVVGLLVWLSLAFWAGRRPYYQRYQPQPRRGDDRDARPPPDRDGQRDVTHRSR